MDEPLERNFIQEMRDALQEQLAEFERTKKKEQHDARIVANEGAVRWHELKASLKSHVEEFNEGITEPLLSYSENTSGNELTLTHELNDRTMQITFDPAVGVISYEGNGTGTFRPRVEGDALEYFWENTAPGVAVKQLRAIRFQDDEPPTAYSAMQMSEILIRCVVFDPASED